MVHLNCELDGYSDKGFRGMLEAFRNLPDEALPENLSECVKMALSFPDKKYQTEVNRFAVFSVITFFCRRVRECIAEGHAALAVTSGALLGRGSLPRKPTLSQSQSSPFEVETF